MQRSPVRLTRSRCRVAMITALVWLVGPSCAGQSPNLHATEVNKQNRSILIGAYAFDQGNVRTIASGSYADAEPVVVNGGTTPNWMEYEIDFPTSTTYTLHVRFAARESRPVDVYVDGKKIAQGFKSVTGSWQSSSAIWERVCEIPLRRGNHVLKLECPGPCIPHIVALRLDSPVEFPKGWKLRRPGAHKLDNSFGALKGYDNGKDGYEAFVRDDGFVNVPDEYNPIIRFERHPAPEPNAHRILEYTLMGPGKYQVEATLLESTRAESAGWVAELSVKVSEGRTESALLPLSDRQVRKMLRHTLELIADFRESANPGYLETEHKQAEDLSEDLEALRELPENDEAKGRRFYHLYLDAYQLKNRVALANPLLGFSNLAFVKRQTYDTSHIYTTYFDGSHRFGGNLYVLPQLRPDAEPRKLAGELGDDGIYRDPDVSWNGKRLLFSYKAKPETAYHLYEIGMDGTSLRQLTDSEFDDIDPVYLPDGRILFVSTRPKRIVLCHNVFTVSVLHTMQADGSNVRCVSANTSNEFTPSLAADGNVLYTRWEYVDKNVGNNQSLWRARPDGTFARHIAGAHWGPITFWEPRQVPGSELIVCTLAPHMPIAVGPIALVDPRDVCRSPAKYTSLTPELPPPHHSSWHRADVGYYCNPYPLSEKYFIVSYSFDSDPRAPMGYGLYLLDRWGNRDLLYRDPKISCFEALPGVARPRLPALPETPSQERPEEPENQTGTFVVLDLYQGLEGIDRGDVKYLRVIEEVPKPVSAECRGYRLQNPVVSQHGNFAVKRLLGTVPIEPDGSAHFEAPTETALYFATLDENYMEIQRMRSFVHVAPGQTVTCIGCHEDRRTAPSNDRVLALRRPASQITPPPGGVHAPDFRYDVQPVLDRYCTQCHSGDSVEGGVDLSGEHTNLFNVAYETLTAEYVNYVNIYSSATLALRPPKFYGSHASKLLEVLAGDHKKYVELPKDALRRIVTWIDCNAPYYGTYRYTRPGTVGGRELISGEVQAALEQVFRKRCASCHKDDTGRLRQVRFPNVAQSMTLRAPLAKEWGGTGRCGKPVFLDRKDPDYQTMLTALRSLQQKVKQNPRVDMLQERPAVFDPDAPYRPRESLP